MLACGIAAAIYMCTLGLGAATTYVHGAPAASRVALAARAAKEIASFVPTTPDRLLTLGALPPPRRGVSAADTAKPAELIRGLLGLMGRQAGVLLLALTVVLLLAAASDGSRPAPAAGANGELLHGSTAEMVVAAPSAAQGRMRRSRSRGGGKDDDLVLREEAVRVTGSSLPDCSHACGACSPCSRVMVSFKCSASEPMPCPMVYRCMCRGKCYPVPSS